MNIRQILDEINQKLDQVELNGGFADGLFDQFLRVRNMFDDFKSKHEINNADDYADFLCEFANHIDAIIRNQEV